MNVLLIGACVLGLVQPPALSGGTGAEKPKASQPVEHGKAARAATPAPRTDPGWVQRNTSFDERAKEGHAKGDIGVVFLGDSITQGWEGSGKAIWAERYAKRGAVNFGIGGDRTEHVLWRVQHGNLEGLAKPEKGGAPKLVVLMIGTNNTGSDPADEIAQGIGADVRAIREKLPQTPVLLLGVFPRGDKNEGALRAKIAEINERAAKLADGTMVQYLDIGPKFLEQDGTISKDVMPDFLHLSEKGYRIWADAMEPKVKEMLKE